jgi:hypothetical protein
MQTEASGVRAQKRNFCDVTIQLAIPKGMQLEFTSVEYRGFMDLQSADSWGYVNSKAYFLGGWVILQPGNIRWISTDQSAPVQRFWQQGPLTNDFYWNGAFDGKQVQRVTSTCDGRAIVRVKSEIISAMGAGGGSSMVTMDSADGAFSQTYRILLKPCDSK